MERLVAEIVANFVDPYGGVYIPEKYIEIKSKLTQLEVLYLEKRWLNIRDGISDDVAELKSLLINLVAKKYRRKESVATEIAALKKEVLLNLQDIVDDSVDGQSKAIGSI